jgi:hypothetical protein
MGPFLDRSTYYPDWLLRVKPWGEASGDFSGFSWACSARSFLPAVEGRVGTGGQTLRSKKTRLPQRLGHGKRVGLFLQAVGGRPVPPGLFWRCFPIG